MLQTRRTAIRVARDISRQHQRRHESVKPETSHAASAGHSESVSHAHHPHPVNEPLGRGFYITLAALPLSFALYKFSRNTDGATAESAQPWFTRMINNYSYSYFQDRWVARNTLHTKMVEQAANDRNLFQSTPGTKMVELKFPEVFNSGSPYNVQAGQTANLDELVAHYQKKNRELQEKFNRR